MGAWSSAGDRLEGRRSTCASRPRNGFVVVIALIALAAAAPAAACTSNAECNDDNPCTEDLCDGVLGCRHSDTSTGCTDGNACTTHDVCTNGTCVGGDRATGCSPCDAAALIAPEGGTFVGNPSGPSTLAGSCGKSGVSPERVYKWTPATSGTATIETCGTATNYDTTLYVRKNSCTGSQVACNDDTSGCATASGTSHGSRVKPNVTAGTTYYIVVDGYDGRNGTYRLTVKAPQKCGNGTREGTEACDGSDNYSCASRSCTSACNCTAPPSGLPDLKPEIFDVHLDYGASVAAGDVAEGCAEQTQNADLLRFSVRNRNDGTADFVLGNPACPAPCTEHPLEVCGNTDFVCSPAQGHNHPHYNNYARYELLDAGGQALVVGHKQGFCLRDSTCSQPRYTCTNQGMRAGCSDVYGSGLGCQYLDVTGVPPGSYRLRVRVDPFNRIAELNDGNNTVEVPVTLGAQSGGGTGTCGKPILLPAAGGAFPGTTSGASKRAGSCGKTWQAPDKVFQWTPTASGTATIETCGTGNNYDTVLYLRPSPCDGNVEIACSNDACANSAGATKGSRIQTSVTAGQRYYIFVDGANGASGNFTLRVTPP